MDEFTLAQILKQTYDEAKRNETVCQVILFGIEYAAALKSCGKPIKRIVELSGIGTGYVPEISKGIQLAKYVQLKS